MSKISPNTKKRSYKHIKQLAEDFLDEHHPSRELPIPIEEIVELKLGFTMYTCSDLMDLYQIDGFLHANLKEITVDDFIFNHREQRARFTIAHEIGHWVMHKNVYKKFKIKTVDDYLKFQNSFSKENQKWLEIQAHIFAGCVLVPGNKLKKEVLKRTNNGDTIQGDNTYPVLADLPELFNVSAEVIMRRLKREKLINESLY